MIEIIWTAKALSDLVRLYDFLSPLNKQAAARVVQSLTAAPARLREYPRLGGSTMRKIGSLRHSEALLFCEDL